MPVELGDALPDGVVDAVTVTEPVFDDVAVSEGDCERVAPCEFV